MRGKPEVDGPGSSLPRPWVFILSNLWMGERGSSSLAFLCPITCVCLLPTALCFLCVTCYHLCYHPQKAGSQCKATHPASQWQRRDLAQACDVFKARPSQALHTAAHVYTWPQVGGKGQRGSVGSRREGGHGTVSSASLPRSACLCLPA